MRQWRIRRGLHNGAVGRAAAKQMRRGIEGDLCPTGEDSKRWIAPSERDVAFTSVCVFLCICGCPRYNLDRARVEYNITTVIIRLRLIRFGIARIAQ